MIYIKRLFVGSLPWATSDEELQEAFSKFGKVNSAVVIKDRQTGRSKGYGFVEMEDDNEALNAIKDMNGADMGGRKIVVNEAYPKAEQQS